ncbi:hypothetical protein, partial [Mucilaginibacter sp. 10I4]|uniref:hypothetical protein n=1 Tax=Mucilaginibacter sp. 10I4 TaxID=3048580 RepID=UPI002B2326EE
KQYPTRRSRAKQAIDTPYNIKCFLPHTANSTDLNIPAKQSQHKKQLQPTRRQNNLHEEFQEITDPTQNMFPAQYKKK